jgi:hypothetical protein
MILGQNEGSYQYNVIIPENRMIRWFQISSCIEDYIKC